ncbi:serine hydroxymethyltransferase [Streptomyces sp. NBC_00234]|uniref:serine hydroxymethyltransferase n=1 Tax=Streptomyces sp. NBC_00234 TaxID=2903638 RepID=UPI002E2E42DC|nr:serine hydroxymethyltransferase [Streptomyces sp. NBC_00234]
MPQHVAGLTEASAPPTSLSSFYGQALDSLELSDPVLHGLLGDELDRQRETLALVASCSPVTPAALVAEGSFFANVTAEGYPGRRFHAGCVNVDKVEQLAIDRAKSAFGARYANVQPHSASTANQVVMTSLLRPGDPILGLDLDAGGHLSHGASVNASGRVFAAHSYGLGPDGLIDYDEVRAAALEHRPRLLIAGTTAYPRTIDWAAFRAIADEVGAYLLADITHIAGLVVAGLHPSPMEHAHIVTTCTHKQLYGPRGGLILLGESADMTLPSGRTLEQTMQAGVFPLIQGAPVVNSIAAKAYALGAAGTPAFTETMHRVRTLASELADEMIRRGIRVISGGTDNHIVVADVLTSFDITGVNAEKALEECGILVNKNRIVGDTHSARVTSGVRFGSNSMAARAFDSEDVTQIAGLVVEILAATKSTSPTTYALDPSVRDRAQEEVQEICRRRPIIGY